MNRCEELQEKLTLYCYGDLPPAEAAEVEEHLASCERCASERRALAATLDSLQSSAFYPDEERVDWERFAAETAGLATGKVVRMRSRFLRPAMLARAAAVIVAVGLGWVALRTLDETKVGPTLLPAPGGETAPQAAGPEGAPSEDTTTVMPVDFRRRLEINMARDDTRRYIEQSRDVLLAVLETPVRCHKNELDISVERAKSMALLRRKQYLRDDLDRPELARAAELCDRLEGILTEISTLNNCADLEKIEELREAVKRNQLLVKIEVAEEELGGTRA